MWWFIITVGMIVSSKLLSVGVCDSDRKDGYYRFSRVCNFLCEEILAPYSSNILVTIFLLMIKNKQH
jgi:hypothetical protein